MKNNLLKIIYCKDMSEPKSGYSWNLYLYQLSSPLTYPVYEKRSSVGQKGNIRWSSIIGNFYFCQISLSWLPSHRKSKCKSEKNHFNTPLLSTVLIRSARLFIHLCSIYHLLAPEEKLTPSFLSKADDQLTCKAFYYLWGFSCSEHKPLCTNHPTMFTKLVIRDQSST